jgi:multiple sugar transport system permease protein
VVLTVSLQMVVGFLLALLFEKQFPLRRYLLILVLTPDDALLRRGGRLLPLLLRADLRPAEPSRARLHRRAVHPAPDARRRHGRRGHRRRLDVVAVRDAAGAGGARLGPKYLYEAAEVDRASWWRRFRTITFPYIKGLLLLALLFRTIEAFKLFDLVFLITNGGPGTSTETIAVYVYRLAFQFFRTSQSAALAYILLFVVIVLTNLYLHFVNRRAREA